MIIAKGLEHKGTKRRSEVLIVLFGLSRKSFLKEMTPGVLTGLLEAMDGE